MFINKKNFNKCILFGLILFLINFVKQQRRILEKIYYERKISIQNSNRFSVINLWLMLKQQGKTLETYFKKYNYNRIAIYGMGELGERLFDELNNTDIYIKYGIDRNAKSIFSTLNIYSLNDKLENVDVVVVTALNDFSIIKEELSKKVKCPIISLKDIIDEVL